MGRGGGTAAGVEPVAGAVPNPSFCGSIRIRFWHLPHLSRKAIFGIRASSTGRGEPQLLQVKTMSEPPRNCHLRFQDKMRLGNGKRGVYTNPLSRGIHYNLRVKNLEDFAPPGLGAHFGVIPICHPTDAHTRQLTERDPALGNPTNLDSFPARNPPIVDMGICVELLEKRGRQFSVISHRSSGRQE